MTRDEAIQKLSDLGFMTPEMIVDGLAVLGALKLDEPAKKVAPLELAMLKLGFAAFQAEAVRKQLEHHGFQIVEKNERELMINTLLKITECAHASDSAAMARNTLRCVGALC